MTQTIPVTAPMPAQLEKQARIAAAHIGVSRAELVRRAVIDYLERLQEQRLTDTRSKYEVQHVSG